MTPGYTILPKAQLDIEALMLWYAHQAGFDLARRFRASAEAVFIDLAAQPGLGRVWPASQSRLRDLRKAKVGKPFGDVLVFYLPTAEGVEIVRVLQGQRDLDAEFGRDN